LGVEWATIVEAIGKTYVVSGVLPLAFGGALSQFNWWVVAEAEFRRRIALVRETLNEHQASALSSILTQTQSMRPIAEIREADGGMDPITAYVKSTLAGLIAHRRLDRIRDRVRLSYTLLMFTMVAALLTVLFATVIEGARPGTAVFCYALVIVQTAIVLWLRHLAGELESNEDAA
jgi:hypothetical protein